MINGYKIIKDIEYAKDLLQNRPEQDTVDYKVWEVLDDALDLIHDLRGQIAKLSAVQHSMSGLMSENQGRIDIEQTFDQTYGVAGGICPTCGNWIQSAHSFCGFCGQPIGWKKRLYDDGMKEQGSAKIKEPDEIKQTDETDGYNLQKLWKRARDGETLNETELNFLLADWDERNIFKQQET